MDGSRLAGKKSGGERIGSPENNSVYIDMERDIKKSLEKGTGFL